MNNLFTRLLLLFQVLLMGSSTMLIYNNQETTLAAILGIGTVITYNAMWYMMCKGSEHG